MSVEQSSGFSLGVITLLALLSAIGLKAILAFLRGF